MASKSVSGMELKILLVFVILIAMLAFAFVYFLAYQGSPQITDEKYCASDGDCACGVRINASNCFYGNRKFVDESRQCPDFCNGIAANLAIRCIDSECVQVNARQ